MKTIIINSFILSLFFISCQSQPQEIEITNNQFAEETDNWDISLNYSSFSSKDEKLNQSCKILNEKIQTLIINLQDSLKTDATNLFNDFEAEELDRPMWKYSLAIDDSIFMSTNRLISIRLSVHTFTGGAHGMTHFYAFNYDVENQRLLKSNEIINAKGEEQINNLLNTNFENTEQCFDSIPTLVKTSVVNLTPTDVCFTYEQYLLGAYVCGVAEVNVPIKDLGENYLLKIH